MGQRDAFIGLPIKTFTSIPIAQDRLAGVIVELFALQFHKERVQKNFVLHGQQRWTSRFSRCTSRTVPREVVSSTDRAWRGSGTASTTQTAGRQTATDARSLLLVLHQKRVHRLPVLRLQPPQLTRLPVLQLPQHRNQRITLPRS